MNIDGFRIYTNTYGHRIAIITNFVDFSDKSYFYYGAFDAVYINMSNSHLVTAILKRINPVTCNETSYLPLFVSKRMKGKLGLHDYVIDDFVDNPTTIEVATKIEDILRNIKERGIIPEDKFINTSSDIFLRIYRYKVLNVKRWKERKIKTWYYTTNLHKGAFMLPKYVEDMLEEEEK